MFSAEQIQKKIEESFDGAKVKVMDMTGTSDHFQILVISKVFEGKSPLERHRMVYDLFGSDVGNAIHAMSITAKTPE